MAEAQITAEHDSRGTNKEDSMNEVAATLHPRGGAHKADDYGALDDPATNYQGSLR